MVTNRVYYFSQYDLTIGGCLSVLKDKIDAYDANIFDGDINDIIELYHIKKHLDNRNRLDDWSDEQFASYVEKSKSFATVIIKYLRSIEREKFVETYFILEWEYEYSFWEVISNYNLLDLLNEEILDQILATEEGRLRVLLSQKRIVDRFGTYFRGVLLRHRLSAHILLDKYEKRDDNPNLKQLFLPASLTQDDKERIIDAFLDQESPNLNYVRLVLHVKDNTNGLTIPPLLRVKAQDVEARLNEELRSKAIPCDVGIGFRYDYEEGAPALREERDGKNMYYVYGYKKIEADDDLHKIWNFREVFQYFREDGLSVLFNRDIETEAMEWVLAMNDSGRDAYLMNVVCQLNNNKALQDIHVYSQVLSGMGKRLENLLKSYYEDHLKDTYGYPSLPLTFPEEDAAWIAKCRTLMPEFDNVAKQYNLFVQYDDIDARVIRYSKPVLTTDIMSLASVRYCSIKESPQEVMQPMVYLFKIGELLHSIDPFSDKHYSCLHDLLRNEKVLYALYEKDYRKPKIDRLIEFGYVKIDADGYLVLSMEAETEVLFFLWRNHVISYWHHSKKVRAVLDKWIQNGWLETDGHLLSQPERDIFNYYLNNSKYTNGPAIRNQYAHGCIPVVNNDSEHASNYYRMLMLLVTLLLKIEEDLCVAMKIIEEGIKV